MLRTTENKTSDTAPRTKLSEGNARERTLDETFAENAEPSGAFGPGPSWDLSRVRILPTTAHDSLEQEADRVADEVLRTPDGRRGFQETAPQPGGRVADDAAARVAQPALAVPGQPLDARTRAYMEPRFGRSFADVRIHCGPAAAESAAALGAQAFTLGRDIVFGRNPVELDSSEGQRLLAHELTHVTQQAAGYGSGRLQAKEANSAHAPRIFWFKLKVDRIMNPDELLREFIRQYYRTDSEADVDKKLRYWHKEAEPGRSATEADVKRKYLKLRVVDHAEQQFGGLSKEAQQEVNAETDQRFRDQTGHEEKLGTSKEDQDLARKWIGIRADVLYENEQSRQLNALPDDIKKILFGGKGHKVLPDEYDRFLATAAKLQNLTPAERQDYLSKVDAGSDSLDDLDKSIDRYLLGRRVREHEEEVTEEAAQKLFYKEDLYKLYRENKVLQQRSRAGMGKGGYNPTALKAAQESDAKLQKALKDNHFDSVRDFEAAIETYRLRFRAEAVNLALEVLARYDHMLYQERIKFQDPANAAALVKSIGGTQAKEHYEESRSKSNQAVWMAAGAARRADSIRINPAAMKAAELMGESADLKKQAEGEVVGASRVGGDKPDPLVDPEQAGRGTSREKLAGMDANEAQQYMLEVVNDRLEDTGKARREFTDDPERIFSLPDLVAATLEMQKATDDTVYAQIVHDYISDQRSLHLFTSIVIGILLLVLTVVTAGVGGWVAAAALVANAALSTYQAFQAIKEYGEQETDYRLKFIQDEPSLLWVGVAIAAAALDLGMTTTQVLKASAAGLKELEVPLKELAAAKDAETAAQKLATLNAKIDAVEGLDQAVKDALKAKGEAEIGLRGALAKMGGKGAMGFADPISYGAYQSKNFLEAMYHAIRKGVNSITKLRGEAEIAELMGDVTKVSTADREALGTAFEQVKKIVAIGNKKKMPPEMVLEYVDRLANERAGGEGAFDAITEEMGAWRAKTAEQIKAEGRLAEAHETLASFKEEKAELEAELRQGPKKPDGTPDFDRVKEIRKDLVELDGVTAKGRGGQYIAKEGKILEAERKVSEAEQLADKAKLDPKIAMRSAFGASDERLAALAGPSVEDVTKGKLLTPPSGIHPDHIVSIQKMTEMEGFGKLTIKERNYLATLRTNLIAMDESANLSKGARSWAEWKQAGNFYDETAIAAMKTRELELRKQIQDWILDTTKGR